MQDNLPALSIVIVNSDGAQLTMNCLDSISENPPDEDFEIILVDNCSHENLLPAVKNVYPRVRTITAPRRQGFSKNYNLGIRQARGEYVMILNNDTIVHAGAFDAMLAAIRRDKSYGMVGPKLLSINGQVQTVCARNLLTPGAYVRIQFILDLALPTGKLWDRYLQWKLERRASGPVPCICGACMLATRKTLDEIGLLDEGYDFYFEDVEWCHRVQKHGLKVAYIAGAEITHLGDQSLSKVKVWAKQSEYLGALKYFSQYHYLAYWQRWVLWVATILSFFFRVCMYGLLESIFRKRGFAKAYRKLLIWVIHQPPHRSLQK